MSSRISGASNFSPEAITRALSRVIRERWSADKAFAELCETVPEEAS